MPATLTVQETVVNAMARLLVADVASLTMDTTLESLGLDPVAVLALVTDIEDEFDFMIPKSVANFDNDLPTSLKTVADMVDLMERALSKKGK